jgi:hypothetical protein
MRVRQLSPTGDWTFGKGINNYISQNAAIEQCIRTRLSFFLGDCFFDATSGIDWWNLLSGKNQLAIQLAVNACLLNTVDNAGNQVVTGILQTSVSLNRTTRSLSISYAVTTIYSTLTSTYAYNFAV